MDIVNSPIGAIIKQDLEAILGFFLMVLVPALIYYISIVIVNHVWIDWEDPLYFVVLPTILKALVLYATSKNYVITTPVTPTTTPVTPVTPTN